MFRSFIAMAKTKRFFPLRPLYIRIKITVLEAFPVSINVHDLEQNNLDDMRIQHSFGHPHLGHTLVGKKRNPGLYRTWAKDDLVRFDFSVTNACMC